MMMSAGYALAQFFGHGADRAELACDFESGLRLECRRQASDQALRGAAAQDAQAAQEACSIAAMRLSRVIGRMAHPYAERIEHRVGNRRRHRAMSGFAGANRIHLRAAGSARLYIRYLAEAQDRVFRPIGAGDALPVEADAFLQYPARGLDGAASIWLTTPSGLMASPTSTARVSFPDLNIRAPSISATTAQ
jgi:hypothetical protein